jgi:hypothetical protein
MAVRAQHSQILQAIIGRYPVYMIDLDRDAFAPPFGNSTFDTSIFKNTIREQARLDVARAFARDQNDTDRLAVGAKRFRRAAEPYTSSWTRSRIASCTRGSYALRRNTAEPLPNRTDDAGRAIEPH